jgi:hypothetical protein
MHIYTTSMNKLENLLKMTRTKTEEERRGRRVRRSRSENKIRGKIDPNQKTIQINMQSGSYRRYACGFFKNLKEIFVDIDEHYCEGWGASASASSSGR